jgi:predicted lipoprotein with Yx(FWY)xxD motif
MSHKSSVLFVVSVLLALTLVVSACSPTTPTTGGVVPLTVVVATDATYGKYLTDAKGMALYFYTPDVANTGKSNCSGACLANWPAFTVANGVTPVGSGITGKFGTITRDDGTIQVTLNGLPLYYFAKDLASGDTKGQGLQSSWYLVSPAGTMIK